MSKFLHFKNIFSRWNWASWISTLSNWLMFGLVISLGLLLILDRFDIKLFEIENPWEFFSKAVPYIFMLFVTRVYSKDIQLMEMASAALEQKHGVIDVIDDPAPQIKKLLAECKNISVLTLSGSNIHSDDESEFLEKVATNRLRSFQIAIADPFSPAIVQRYQNDEPNSAKSGPEKIKETILEMHRILQGSDVKLKNKVEIRVFSNYPTQSIFTADGEVLVSAYGYKLRKGDTPTTYTRSNTRLGSGVQKHFEEVFASSTPLSEWICRNFVKLNEVMPVSLHDHYSGVFISLIGKDEFLFQRRGRSKGIENSGLLSVFGGRREESDREDPKLTAIRELREETGISIGTDQIRPLCQMPYVPEKSPTDVVLATYYLVENININDITVVEGKGEKYRLDRVVANPDLTTSPKQVINEFLQGL